VVKQALLACFDRCEWFFYSSLIRRRTAPSQQVRGGPHSTSRTSIAMFTGAPPVLALRCPCGNRIGLLRTPTWTIQVAS